MIGYEKNNILRIGDFDPASSILTDTWTQSRGTGYQTTHNRSHFQLIIYFWAEVGLVTDYTNIDIFQWN